MSSLTHVTSSASPRLRLAHARHVFHVGTNSNKSAIGARATATAVVGGKRVSQVREVSNRTGKTGQNSLRAHFGFGDADRIEALYPRWPSGFEETLFGVAVNQ
ncbi:MAG: hypothetical protein GY906_11750 [bacterium]|nr:hypothetical protein [bacterium]